MLRQVLGSVASSGKATPGTVSDDLTPGKAVDVVLMDGDFQLAANGTVTDRYGDQVLAFGHPFLGLGPVRVPMATAEVVTVLSNANSSFKISNSGRIVGAFEQDRKTGIQGRIGAEAPMIPMVLRVKSERPREYRMRLAALPDFVPLLVGSGVVAGLEAASYTTGSQSLDLTARLGLRGYGDLVVRQSFDGNTAVSEASSFLLAIVSYISQNPLEKVDVESVEVDLAQTDQPVFASLVGANASRTVVRPGDRVMLNLDFVPYRGDRFRHSMPLDLPGDLPAGRYSLLVGDGASVDAARLSLEPAEPVSFPQALEPAALVPLAARPDRAGGLQRSGSFRGRRGDAPAAGLRALALGGRGLGERGRPALRRRAGEAGDHGRADPGAGADRPRRAPPRAGGRRRSGSGCGGERRGVQRQGEGMRRARFNILAAGLLLAAAVLPASGTQVKIFQARSQTAFLAGTLDGVSIDALGRMQLAPKVDRVASVAEPFLLSAAVHRDGWVVGTGNAGKVLKIDRKGGVTELFTAPEPEIFAVWSDPDGTVYAGTSPQRQGLPDPAGPRGESS